MFGIFLTRLLSYIALVAAIAWAICWFVKIKSPRSICIASLASLMLISSIATFGVRLILRPYSGNTVIEDRTDFVPAPKPSGGTAGLLKADWSTSDEYSSWPVAELMLELSRRAYDDPIVARQAFQKLGFESETLNNKSMQGYALSIDDSVVLCFRGTEINDPSDILQDLLFIRSRNDGGSIHGGFDSGYRGMHDQALAFLDEHKPTRVWITGHSLGGAMSVACAYHLIQDTEYEIGGVMTFGQPMTVNRSLAAILDAKLFGKYVYFINDMDPVARAVEPYVHFGFMVHYVDGEIVKSDPPMVMYGATPSDYETPKSIDTLDDNELDKLIRDLQEANEPAVDENGNPVVKGFVPNVFDHFLDSYAEVVHALVHGNKR
ncbi:MAG: lipase family protein [Pirellulaceae bacterium]|nr:lipase family protein [Pirellulaceae bacterium]